MKKERKSAILITALGLLIVGTIYATISLASSYNRYRIIKRRIDTLRTYNLLNAGLARAIYKIKNNNYSNETFHFPAANDNITIIITPNAVNPTHNTVINTTAVNGIHLRLQADFQGTFLTNYTYTAD